MLKNLSFSPKKDYFFLKMSIFFFERKVPNFGEKGRFFLVFFSCADSSV